MTLQKTRWGRFFCIVSIATPGACAQVPPPAAPVRAAESTHSGIAVPQEERRPDTERVVWQSRAIPSQLPSITGVAVSMAEGQRCTSFRTLPFLEFHRDTLIQDACLEIPSNTTVVIHGGTHLGIIAVNELRVGRNVRFTASGTQGSKGERADFELIRYTPDTDAAINAACVDAGNHCTCPVGDADAAAIRGHVGGAGSSGGFVTIVARGLAPGAQFKGLTVDVSGGLGGPPGASGRRTCERGAIRCESSNCTDGAVNGAKGADGHVRIAIGPSTPILQLRTLNPAMVASGAVTVTSITSGTALQNAIQALSDVAFNGGWDRRSGQEGY